MSGARAATLAGVIAAAGCLVPPSQSSFGGATTGLGVGYRVSVGAHASALDRTDEMRVDLGAGWVSEGGEGRQAVHGTYISLGRKFPLGAHHALWLSGRAEVFWGVDPGQPSDGLVARLALRRHLAGVRWGSGDSSSGFGAFGAFAAGLYVDLGARRLDGGDGEMFVSAGVTFELPGLAGVGKPGLIH